MNHGSLGHQQRILPVIEGAFLFLHCSDRPGGHFLSQLETLWVTVRKERKSFDRLRDALNIYGIRPRVVVLRAPTVLKEVSLVVRQAFLQVGKEFVIAAGLYVTIEAVEVVAGMKIVNPLVVGCFGVPPGTVQELTRTAIFHRRASNLEEFFIPVIHRGSGKKTRSQHVGVVYRTLHMREVA